MNEPNNMIASCYNDAVYSTSWPKTQPVSVTEQLEKWNKVRQSLYSQNGWCSENVNQISKWDVGDSDKNGLVPQMNMHTDGYETGTNNWNVNYAHHQHSYETGTNNWDVNLTHHQHGSEPWLPYPPEQDPFCIASNTAAAAATTMSTNTPSQQSTHWENTGAIPKMFNNNNPTNLNCLSVNAPPSNFEFPTPGSSSQQIASPENQNATVFYDCDNLKSPPTNTDTDEMEVNLALRLQFETMNLEKNAFCNETNSKIHAPNLNPISRSICQMSNKYQVDCLPHAFS